MRLREMGIWLRGGKGWMGKLLILNYIDGDSLHIFVGFSNDVLHIFRGFFT